jgi:chorismate mutase
MANTTLTFTLEGRDRLSKVLDKVGDSAKGLEKKLVTAGAAIPAAAALAPLAAQAGAAAVAVAAFGAAIVPQIGALSDASKAQTKYEDAVAKSGATSEAAISAQVAFQQQIAKMPPATRVAAAGLSTLKKEYSAWSDGLAKDTMPVFTKGLAVAGALLPKLTPLVKGASTELNRFMTTVAGGVNTSGFDRLSSKFSDFATGSLKKANDGLIHLLRTFDTGKVGGSLSEFMDYARAQGPLLADTLKNVATAAVHLLTAASGVGVGLLQLANAAAAVVSSLPTGFITTLMQTAIAIRAVRLAGAGIQLLAGGFTAASAAIRTIGTAAIGASTTMGSLRAAFMALSVSARMTLAATGIGLLAVALYKLSTIGKQAPPNVERLTTSLGNLARTGKASGEAARAFGSDLGGLADSLRTLARPSNLDKTQQAITSFFGMDSTPVKEAKQNLDAVDKSLASLVQGGKADVASAAFDRVAAAMRKQGMSGKELKAQLGDYKSAIADAAFEQQVAAQSMGLFGSQAQKTQAALAQQKQSADGLRQSIQALNDAQRQGLSGMIGFEASIDAAAKAAKENAGSLHMVNGQLDVNSPKAQAAATALNDLAAKTDEAAAQARQSTGSWEAANKVYERGRSKLIDAATAMGLTKSQAKALADQILRTPDKTARLKGNIEDLEAKVTAAKKRLSSVPASRKAFVRGDISNLEYEVSRAQARLRAIDGKTAVTYVLMKTKTSNAGTVFHEGGNYAAGGPIGFPGGGPISGPGTGTSDSIPIMASNGEYMINARSTAKYRSLVEAINSDTLGGGRGMPGAGAAVAQGLMSGMAGATSGVDSAARSMAAAVVTGIRAELQIASPSKKTKALAADVGKGLIVGLTGSRAKIKSVSADLAKDIWAAFTGSKDNRYVAMVNKQTKKLLDAAAKRDKLASTIATAKKYASDVTSAARETAGLSNLGMQPEEVTAGGIKAGLASKLSQIKQFTKYIGILAKKGLGKGLLRQILNMGPEAGYAYASALVGADKGTFKSINSLQGQLDKSTTTLGRTGADLLYDSGKKAGKGFLTGLAAQQKDIENLMLKIAKGMQKAIKKALGIKSPSRVMAQLGAYSTQGLARGLIEGVPVLDRALGVVTGRVAGAQPVLGRAAVAGAGGGVVYNVNVTVQEAMDPIAVGRELQRVIVQLGRAQGGTVRLNLGG